MYWRQGVPYIAYRADPHEDDEAEHAGEVRRGGGEGAEAEDHELLDEGAARLAQRVAWSGPWSGCGLFPGGSVRARVVG